MKLQYQEEFKFETIKARAKESGRRRSRGVVVVEVREGRRGREDEEQAA